MEYIGGYQKRYMKFRISFFYNVVRCVWYGKETPVKLIMLVLYTLDVTSVVTTYIPISSMYYIVIQNTIYLPYHISLLVYNFTLGVYWGYLSFYGKINQINVVT